jgi:hypothetical protein
MKSLKKRSIKKLLEKKNFFKKSFSHKKKSLKLKDSLRFCKKSLRKKSLRFCKKSLRKKSLRLHKKSLRKKSLRFCKKSLRKKSLRLHKKSLRKKSLRLHKKIFKKKIFQDSGITIKDKIKTSINSIFLNKLLNILNNVRLKDPFKQFYKFKIDKIRINMQNAFIHINQFDKESFKYKAISQVFEKNNKYSTNNINVFFRQTKEALKYLLGYDYYTEVNFNNINLKDENLKEYNPHIFDSFYSEDYIVSSTITPIFENNIIIFAINRETKKQFNMLDFYFNPMFIYDMFSIFQYLTSYDKNYILYSFIENGSLFETFHFHIINSEFQLPIISDGIQIFKNIDSHLYPDSYLLEINKDILFKIPKMLYNLRSYDSCRYTSSIFFLKKNEKEYLYITFRKIEVAKIVLLENQHFDQEEYWNKLFGKKSRDYPYYLPIGIIATKKSFLNKVKEDLDFIKKFIENENNFYHIHPNFTIVYKQIMDNEVIYENYDPVNYDEECINLSCKDIISKEEHKLTCYKLPILYKLSKKWLNNENGSMLIDGSYFYYIKCYDEIKFNQKPEIFLKLFSKIETNDGTKYYLFNNVKTYLTDFILMEQHKLQKDSSLINAFIIMIIYKMYKLYSDGEILSNLDINCFYVCNNPLNVIDYVFDEINFITISKDNTSDCKFKINHEGNEIFLPLSKIKNETHSNSHLIEDINKIFEDLNLYCKTYNITNMLLTNIILNKYKKMDELIKSFNFGIDYWTCKHPNYNILKLLKSIFNYDKELDNEFYKYIVEEIIEKNKKLDPITSLKLTEKKIFVHGTNTENIYYSVEGKYKIGNFPLYLFPIDDNNDEHQKTYYDALVKEYAKNNSFSRVILYEQYKDNKYIQEKYEDFNIQFLNLTGKENFWNITSKIINSSENYLISQLCESTINFLLNIAYKNSIDFMILNRKWFVEYVSFRTNESLKCKCIILLCSDHFKIFYDYYSYSEYFNNIDIETKVDYNIENLELLYKLVISFCRKNSYKHSFYDRPQIDIDIIYFKKLLEQYKEELYIEELYM